MPESHVRSIGFRAARALCGVLWLTGQTEPTTTSGRSFRETRSTWSRFSSSTSADDGDFVRHSAEDVEDQVVDEQRRPRTDGDDA
jgi:hypothetical protein